MHDPFVIECTESAGGCEHERFEDPAASPLVIGDAVSDAVLSAVFVDHCPARRHRPLWRALASRWLAPVDPG